MILLSYSLDIIKDTNSRNIISYNVSVPPTIDEANLVDNPKVVINRTVLLECPVEGIPPPEVRWLKDSKPLILTKHMALVSEGRQLEIANAQVSDTAVYTCIAINEAGELTRNFELDVLGKHHTLYACFYPIFLFHVVMTHPLSLYARHFDCLFFVSWLSCATCN